jgi:hypothetical protein
MEPLPVLDRAMFPPSPLTVSLIGSPCSGRHTVAVQMFLALQAAGVHAEFLVAEPYHASDRLALAPPPAVQVHQATDLDMLLRRAQARGVEVAILSDSFLMGYLAHPAGFTTQAEDAAALATLRAFQGAWRTLTYVLERPVNEQARGTNGQLCERVRAARALTWQMREGLDHLGVSYIDEASDTTTAARLADEVLGHLQRFPLALAS